jgi:hypothetical protein
MSISGFSGIYTLECDICGNEAGGDFDSFYEAVEWKKDRGNGWISRNTDTGWEDVCPDCHGTAFSGTLKGL